MTRFDCIIVGAGMAGVSAGAELIRAGARVAIFEQESQPGYHSTGRSAAILVPSLGPLAIRQLTTASAAFFEKAAGTLCDQAVLHERGAVMVIDADANPLSVEAARAAGMREASLVEIKARVPAFRADRFSGALIDPGAADIDVDLVHTALIRQFRKGGGVLVVDRRIVDATFRGGLWRVDASGVEADAPIFINAAGAWCDDIAARAGVAALGLEPRRRSAAIVPVPDGWTVVDWPLFFSATSGFYVKPMGGKLMLSPGDAQPVEPHDAWSDDMALAEAVEQLESTIDITVDRIESSWGGLRTFARDGQPVVGFDADHPGFFWLAGQGGYGIQAAPALARLTAALVLNKPVPDDIVATGLTLDALDPQRLRTIGR